MIIDTHTHFGNTGLFNLTENTLIDSINKFNIDYFVVSNLEGSEFDMQFEKISNRRSYNQIDLNQRTVDLVKKYNNKCIGQFWKIGRASCRERV